MGMVNIKKVEITGPREILNDVLDRLQDFSLVHIEDSPFEGDKKGIKLAITEEEKKILKDVEKGIDMIEEIRKIYPYKRYMKQDIGVDEKKNINEYLSELEKIWKEFSSLREKKRKIEEERSLYFSFKTLLESFEELYEKREIEIPEDFEIWGSILSREDLVVINRIEKDFKENYGDKVKIFTKILRENKIALLICFSPNISEAIRNRLWKEGLPEISLPSELASLSFSQMLVFLRKKLEEIPLRLKEIDKEFSNFMDSSFEFIFSVYFLLQDIRDFLRAKSRGIFVTKYFFYLEGFVPETEIKKLKEFLKNFKDVYIREMSPEHGEYERIPVVLKNPSFFKNFEPLIEFFSLPVYRSFDPTPLIGIFFPVYFGFMLGDMGYGLLGSLLFLFLYFKFKDNLFIRRISFVFLMAALSSIFFGFLYMEMFGDVLEKMGFHPIFHRVHSANTYLLIALVFGTIQIIMGLLLGIWNNIRLGHNKHAIGVLTMLLGLLCVLGLAGTSLRVLPSSLGPIFLILLFVFMILSFIFHGPAAPIEIFSAFAHILSFARLMAIGLSSAIIAMIANSFLNLLPSLFIGILAMFLFHILAFVLGLFDPTVQGLRLQFVEFFTKFYSPGGRIYSPFYKRLKGVQIPNMIK